MAKGVNKVILVGNCGQDPELRYSTAGTAFANVSIATTEKWKDKQTGNNMESTEWHRLVFAARLAEVVGEYVTKGMTIYVEGKLKTRKWTDQAGVEKFTTEVHCFEMQMLGGGIDNAKAANPQQHASHAPQQGGYSQTPKQPAGNAYAQYHQGNANAQQTAGYASSQRPAPQQRTQPQPNNAPPTMNDFDDDIGF